MRGGDSRERLYWDPVNQDIGEIIANCASTHWADRKDGLIGLQCYFRDGRMLSASELRRVTDIFARMFMDAHTKVFTLFLDSLIELVVTHKDDLRDWLHILITRLLNKLGADLLGSIVQKIYRTLDVIKESFPLPEQLTVLMRFLVDQAITPNVKVKVATMKHVASVSQGVQTGLLLSDTDEQMALAKIITWTYEPKSPEVRRHSQAALVSVFRLNASHYGRILAKLPKSFQDNANPLVSAHLMNESTATLTPTDSSESPTTDSADTLPTLKNNTASSSIVSQSKISTVHDSLLDSTLITGSGPSPMKPRSLHSPNSLEGGIIPARKSIQGSRGLLDPADDAENLNPEEIHQSLRSTANAIQNYTFDPDVKGDKSYNTGMRNINIPIVHETEKITDENICNLGYGKGDCDNLPNIKDTTSILEEQMSLLDINGSKFANGNDTQINKNNIENLTRGMYTYIH
jgi:CLIP-associating protein 1/2